MNTKIKLFGRITVIMLALIIIMSIPAAVLASSVSNNESITSGQSQSTSDSEKIKPDSADAAEKADGTSSATVSNPEKSGKHKHSDSGDSTTSGSTSSDGTGSHSGKHKNSDKKGTSSSGTNSGSEKKGTQPNEKAETSSSGTNADGNTPPDGMTAPPDGFGGGNGAPPDGPGGGNGTPPDGGMGTPPGGGSSGVDSYTAVKEYKEDTTVKDEEIKSTGTDENAVLISDGNVVLDGVTVTRDSSDSSGGDNASFYGVGSAILTKGGTSYITDASISTDAAGGAGTFAYSDGVVYIADSVITTLKGASGGIHAAGGGTLYAWNLDVTTNGQSSAAIRSDRGGGTMVIDGGTYTSNGVGSPAVYCTADIAVNGAVLAATGSEAICIEGLNTLYLFDCDLTGSMKDDTQNDCTWTVIVYQSMSGDSQVGCGTFQMAGGKLTSTNGGLFYTTNTESSFVLKNVEIVASDDCEFFLRCTGNENSRGWGTVGKNGADCVFTAIEQEMNGDIVWDSVSTLKLYMTGGSTLTGAFVNDESCAGSGGSGYAELYISEDSKWTVTGDSVVTNLYNAGTIVDRDGNTVTVKGTDGTVYVSGTGKYTVTVTSYKDNADLSGAGTAEAWEAHKVEKPTVMSVSKTSETVSEEISSEVSQPQESSTTVSEAAESEIEPSEPTDESNSAELYIIIIAACILIAAGITVAVITVKQKKDEPLIEGEEKADITDNE